MATPGEPLTISNTSTGLAVRGEIDAHTAPALSEAIAAARTDANLQIDMSQVDFVDSSGLRVIIEAHQLAEADGGALELIDPSPAVQRLLEISGVDDYLNVVKS